MGFAVEAGVLLWLYKTLSPDDTDPNDANMIKYETPLTSFYSQLVEWHNEMYISTKLSTASCKPHMYK